MLDFDKRQLISLLEISRVIHGFDQSQEKENSIFGVIDKETGVVERRSKRKSR